MFEVPQYAAADPATTSRRRASTSSSTSRTPPATTATRCTASRRGWTPRSASPSTGTAACPNVFLGAPLKSDGTWNSAHFKNKEYDQLAAEYVAAIDLQSQRAAAKKIQEMLLDEVPIIFSYFYFYLSATKPTVAGVERLGHGPGRRHPGGPEGLSGRPRSPRGGARHRPLPRKAHRPRADHAAAAEHRDLPGRPGAAGRRGAAHPRAVRRSGVGRRAEQGARARTAR